MCFYFISGAPRSRGRDLPLKCLHFLIGRIFVLGLLSKSLHIARDVLVKPNQKITAYMRSGMKTPNDASILSVSVYFFFFEIIYYLASLRGYALWCDVQQNTGGA